MTNNTQLPAEGKPYNKLKLLPQEWQDEILAFAGGQVKDLDSTKGHDFGFYCGALGGLTVGATEYASKLHAARTLLEKVIYRHEGGLLPDRLLYNEIKTFLDGTK